MHSDHRARYHVRPASDVYPGDTISTDPAAIAAVNGDGPDDSVDWAAVEEDAVLVRFRRRPRPARLRFTTDHGPVTCDVLDDVLVVRERSDGTDDGTLRGGDPLR